jgi:regulator of protease activity HflC (stomatin/prohibitin superfamily)
MAVVWVLVVILVALVGLGLIRVGSSVRMIKQYERGVVFRSDGSARGSTVPV